MADEMNVDIVLLGEFRQCQHQRRLAVVLLSPDVRQIQRHEIVDDDHISLMLFDMPNKILYDAVRLERRNGRVPRLGAGM